MPIRRCRRRWPRRRTRRTERRCTCKRYLTMPTPVVMPQMGESVTEGTVVRWIRQVGDPVDRDEPLFEISTDKVDAEIPSPAAGILREIRVREGETVAVDTVVAVLGEAGEAIESADDLEARPAQQAATPEVDPTQASDAPPAAPGAAAAPISAGASDDDVEAQRERRRRTRSSPLVRNIAAEHGVDVAEVDGTGVSGRVTKRDILRFLDDRNG